MRLTVIHRAGCRYRGVAYPKGSTLEIDENAHNGAAEIRYLKALNKVEEAAAPAPAGKVAETRALEPAPAPVEPAAAPEAPESPPEPAPVAPARRGRYQRRDLRAQD